MSTVVIRIQGTNVTPDVYFEDAKFTTSTGSYPGEFDFRIKDPTQKYNFQSGNNVTLDIDGTRMFDGYALQISQEFAFEVVDTSKPEVLIWHLRGPDLAILFQKRVVYTVANPKTIIANFPTGTTDLTALNSLIGSHLDLSGDSLTTDFHNVGVIAPDEPGLPFASGDRWNVGMDNIAQLPGGVWGIKPNRTVFYEDDQTENAPFRLSDVPDNVTTFGYSDLEWMSDGTRLANDAPAWGAGVGLSSMVYDRTEDAASIAAHGRWQAVGLFRTDVFRQTTINKISQSVVYGSPQHLHGGKDDALVITCRVKKPGLVPGQKVYIESQVFGVSGVYPIRRLTMTFPTPHDVFYDIEASYDIDRPYAYHNYLGVPGVTPPIIVVPPPPPPPCIETPASGGWFTGGNSSSWQTQITPPVNQLPGPNPEVATIDIAGGPLITNFGGQTLVGAGEGPPFIPTGSIVDATLHLPTDSAAEFSVGFDMATTDPPSANMSDYFQNPGGGLSQADTYFTVTAISIGADTFLSNGVPVGLGPITLWIGRASVPSRLNPTGQFFASDHNELWAYQGFANPIDFPDPTTWVFVGNSPLNSTISCEIGVSASANVLTWNFNGTGGSFPILAGPDLQLQSIGTVSLEFFNHAKQAFDIASQASWNFGQLIWYDSQTCGLRGGTPVAGTTTAGSLGCETPTKINSTTWQTSYAFIPGTLEVYLSGTQQRVNIDYHELAPNQFQFGTAPEAMDTVYCCFQAQGSTSTGGGRILAT